MLVSGSVAALKYCAACYYVCCCSCFVEMPIFMHFKDERLKRESTVVSSMLTKTLGDGFGGGKS